MFYYKISSQGDGTELGDWLRFIKSDDEEELDMLAQKTPQLKKAVGILKELSADERTRMIAEDREKARRDEVARMNGAMKEGITKGRKERGFEIAQNMLDEGMSIDVIAKFTGLSHEEIGSLMGK